MEGDQPAVGTDHDHDWVKEGPAAVRGSAGTELWIVYTCAVEGCRGWKREDLYTNHEAGTETSDSNGGVSNRQAVIAFLLALALVSVLFGVTYFKSIGVLP